MTRPTFTVVASSDQLSFDPRTVDNWSQLSHKAGLNGDDLPFGEYNHLPRSEQRRMVAYKILSAYMVNAARFVLGSQVKGDSRHEHREYGDPALFVERYVSGILGKELNIQIPEIIDALAPPPTLDDKPSPPAGVALDDLPDVDVDGGDIPEDVDLETYLYLTTAQVWEVEKRDAISRWRQSRGQLPELRKAETFLNEWFDSEGVVGKFNELETEYTVPLGDGVLGLSYSTRKNRPILTVYPPDAYFPDLTGSPEFPTTVHLIWQEPSTPDSGTEPEAERWRRITYQLVQRTTGERFKYEDQAGDTECVITDVTFNIGDYSPDRWTDAGDDITQWPTAMAEITLNEDGEELEFYPLGIDFIPIVHFPHTPASANHFGRSGIARIVRLFDDIAGVDTDITRAEALAGSPVVGITGVAVGDEQRIEPGRMWGLGKDGRMDALDISHNLTSLLESKDAKLERASVNGQIPESMLGRLDEAGDFPSGISILLSFQSFINLVDKLRLVRHPKYRLVMKFAQRIELANNPDADFPVVNAGILFGEFIPADLAGIAESLSKMLESHGISRKTAVIALKEAGLPIADVEDEVVAIGLEDAQSAKFASEATSSDQIGAEMLGRTLDTADTTTTDDLDDGNEPPSIDLGGL